MQHSITWEKSQKGEKALDTAQKHVELPCKILIAPVKNCFVYIIHSFRSIIENKGDIKYLYVSMDNTSDIIREGNPALTDWSTTSTGVMTMHRTVGSIVKNQASGGKWLISEEITDTVKVYIYCSGDEADAFLMAELDQLIEYKDGLAEDRQLIRNLEETHMRMWENSKIKLAKYLEPLLEVPSTDK